jgi:hypothetical protein
MNTDLELLEQLTRTVPDSQCALISALMAGLIILKGDLPPGCMMHASGCWVLGVGQALTSVCQP